MDQSEVTLQLSYFESKETMRWAYTISKSLTYKQFFQELMTKYLNLECITINGKDYEGDSEELDEKTFTDISDDTLVKIYVSVQEGLGINGPDLTKPKETVKVVYNPKARVSNTVVDGFNIRGKCTNSKCDDFNLPVVHQWGMGEFDYVSRNGDIKCPSCKTFIEADMFIFCNCEYIAKGKYCKKGENGFFFLEEKWERISDGCHRLNGDDVGKIGYLDLRIETRKL